MAVKEGAAKSDPAQRIAGQRNIRKTDQGVVTQFHEGKTGKPELQKKVNEETQE